MFPNMSWTFKLLLLAVLGASCVLTAKPRRKTNSPFIVGGRESFPGSWPWQAGIEIRALLWCGGVLIDERWVLTNAQCIEDQLPLFYEVSVGIWDYGDWFDPNIQILIPERFFTHPDFISSEADGYPHDIGLIRLQAPGANINVPRVALARLPANDTDYTGKECVITGWGNDESGFPPSDILYEADIDAISNSECQDYFATHPIRDDHMCAYDTIFQSTAACIGDHGGPISCDMGGGVYEVAGISSWGDGECNPAYPSVFSSISKHLSWIRETIANNP